MLPPVLERAGLRLDRPQFRAWRDGELLALSPKEFAVLEVLMRAEGRVVSAEELLEKAWDENAGPFTNAVRVAVLALRKKLGDPPLIATYRDQHVLVSNTYSKASLRVAAEEISLARPGVAYFPSYEIITSPATSRNYYLDDLRSVSLLGVDHVMRVFFAHCVAGSKKTAASPPALPSELREEIRNVGQIVCDEEAIVKL